ncbi:hypothetical protein [Vibrio parahaemolyticus]|uniref:hypothetical protein n=1 Tax=Vibrio parahaemolyticus TaxID=670 RepID=UPI00235E7C07|nr:hypothetical protein [Vibrio parahaemolyticus]
MEKNVDFKWVIYPSNQGKKKGLKGKSLERNQKLPAKFRGNSDYKLKLHEGEKTFNKGDLEISRTKAKIKVPGGEDKSIPNIYFESGVLWLLSLSRQSVNKNERDLVPMVFWSLILFSFLYVGTTLSQDKIVDAVNLLISENASKITVLLGVVGFVIFSLIYLFIPTKYEKAEKSVEYICEQFFGLIIGAASFCIASFFILLLNGKLTLDLTLSFLIALFICLLSHCIRCFYKELNQFIDNHDRCVFTILCFITIILVFGYFIRT